MVRILPDRLRHDQRALGVDACKDLQPFFGGADEAMPPTAADRMGPFNLPAEVFDGAAKLGFQLLLGWPADAVGFFAKVAAGHQRDS